MSGMSDDNPDTGENLFSRGTPGIRNVDLKAVPPSAMRDRADDDYFVNSDEETPPDEFFDLKRQSEKIEESTKKADNQDNMQEFTEEEEDELKRRLYEAEEQSREQDRRIELALIVADREAQVIQKGAKALEASKKRAEIRTKRNRIVLNHVLVELLEVGTYEQQNHPYTQFLNTNDLTNPEWIFKMTPDDYESQGYQLSLGMSANLAALQHWFEHPTDDAKQTTDYIRILAFRNEDLQAYKFSLLRGDAGENRMAKTEAKRASTTTTTEQSSTDHPIPPTGANSNTGKLRKIRQSVGFVGNAGNFGVTGRTKSRAERASASNTNPPTTGYLPHTPAPAPAGQQPQPSSSGTTPPQGNNTGGSGNQPSGGGSGGGNAGGSQQGGSGGGGPPHWQGGFGSLTGGGGSGGNPPAQQIQLVYPPTSRVSEFDKGGKRSSSDYEKFSNKDQWRKWQRTTLGTACEHKVEQVLDSTYVPDPNDPDACALFASQQRFMYSVFTKVLTEGKAADILRNYSDPADKTKFGDAQSIYSELCDHFEGGAQARVSAKTLETELTNTRLRSNEWDKSIRAFVNKIAHLIRDHKEATHGIHDDTYYIEKLNNTMSEHRDMSTHIQNIEIQNSLMDVRFGTHANPLTYDMQLHNVMEAATTLDERYKQQDKTRRAANKTNTNGNGNGNGNGGSKKKKQQANSGKSNKNNNNSGGNGNQKQYGGGPGFVPNAEWNNLTGAQKWKIINERKTVRERQANAANAQGAQPTNDGNSTIAGPPTTIHVAAGQQQPAQSAAPAQQQPGSMLRNMMTQAGARSANATRQQPNDEVTINGTVYRRANVTYRVSCKEGTLKEAGGLVDGGANGGVLGEDVRVIEHVENVTVDLTGIADSAVDGLKLALGAAVVNTVNDGPIIALMAQYADLGKGKTIHSKGQLEHFGAIVDDTSRTAGGRQCIITTEGYVIPISIRDGLPRIDMRPPTDEEISQLPAVYLTSDTSWDPRVLDNECTDETFYEAIMDDPEVQQRRENRDPRVDDFGMLRSREAYEVLFKAQDDFIANTPRYVNDNDEVFYDAHATSIEYIDPGNELNSIEREPTRLERAANAMLSIFPNRLRKKFPSLDALKPYFGWASNDKIKLMLDKTSQHYRGVVHHPFRHHYKTRFPAANVKRRNEWVATDTFFCDTPAADDGIPGHGGATMMHNGVPSYYCGGIYYTPQQQGTTVVYVVDSIDPGADTNVEFEE